MEKNYNFNNKGCPDGQQYPFPEGFEWGCATASYQIEGAWNRDQKGESIWDRFTHVPGHIADSTNGDNACEFYDRYQEDLKLAKELGMQVYRMSISWARIFPEGTGQVCQAGVDFYRKVLGCIHENGMKSAVTLYHWDLPQKLQDKGGWANREIVDWFEQYAKTVFLEFGDLVDRWITLNEPYCSSFLGYWKGEHAPGYHDYSMALQAVHHLLMAHGAAVKAYRRLGLSAEIGITLNMNMTYPKDSGKREDIQAARRMELQNNCLFGDPVMKGEYPQELFNYLEQQGVVLPKIYPGDMELINQRLDFLGLNNYYAEYVQEDRNQWPIHAIAKGTGRDRTEAGWEVCPDGLYDLLHWINDRYRPEKLLITENGAACNDWLRSDGRVQDTGRIDFLTRYLQAVHRAVTEGVLVTGYYVWCFCDNFEWAWGLKRRFGIVYVDYQTQERYPKDSAYWLSDVIRKNGF